jgi:hypothetical protein
MLSLTSVETISVAAAESVTIGTVSARGDFRVDSHLIRGNATLFNGSVVETGTATADLRISKGAAVTLSPKSRGTLYSDRLVLQQGESEVTAPETFQLEVEGLHVTASGPNSQGVVSLKPGNTVQVSALSGAFNVTNDHGLALANVSPGRAITFAFQAGASGSAFTGTGRVTFSDGHYYLTEKGTGAKYELKGQGLSRLAGKEVTITGTIQSATAAGGALDLVDVVTTKVLFAGLTGTTAAIIGGVVVAASVGTAVGVYEANQGSNPASR